MELDITTVIGLLLFSIIGLIGIYINSEKINFVESYRLILIGFSLIIVMSFMNCLIEDNWDITIMVNFLTLKKVGGWMFRVLASFGYLCVFWGIAMFIACKIKNVKKI